jgi:hypothetical protein
MDEDFTPKARRVDEFIVAVAAKLRVAEAASHEEAVANAILLLRDRLHRDVGPDDIIRLAGQMRDKATAECDAVLMRSRFALPRDSVARQIRFNRDGGAVA